jgi:hypothetical protein
MEYMMTVEDATCNFPWDKIAATNAAYGILFFFICSANDAFGGSLEVP